MNNYILKVSEDEINIRADVFVSKRIENLTRTHVQKLIDGKNILINNKPTKSSYKVTLGDEVNVIIPPAKEERILPENIPLDVVYEDNDIIIINKKRGMTVHPAVGNYTGTLVNAIMARCKDSLSGINGVIRPGIVHRIDKDTSGLLVVAKNDTAHLKLAHQLKEYKMDRIYIALVKGKVKNDSGIINAQIGRHPVHRKKMAVIANGRNAVTHYRVLERFDKYTLIEAKLETGRTHQIRVHMSHIGHPLVGDPVYGSDKGDLGFDGQALHAKTLGLVHPTTGEYMKFNSELPDYFKEALRKLGSSQNY